MKHIPILYQTEMIKAKIAGRKTMTRRLRGLDLVNQNPDAWKYEGANSSGFHIFSTDKECNHGNDEVQWIKCPYGQPGDVLWTREKFFSGYHLDENDQIQDDSELAYWYFADTRDARPGDISDEMCMHLWGNNKECWPRWKPGLHMPKSACRMWDEIVSIRAERVADISEEDAIAEGIKFIEENPIIGGELYPGKWYNNYLPTGYSTLRPIDSFKSLFKSINGPESWEQNQWVWVIGFERINKPENFI